jgi:hypothetical protein
VDSDNVGIFRLEVLQWVFVQDAVLDMPVFDPVATGVGAEQNDHQDGGTLVQDDLLDALELVALVFRQMGQRFLHREALSAARRRRQRKKGPDRAGRTARIVSRARTPRAPRSHLLSGRPLTVRVSIALLISSWRSLRPPSRSRAGFGEEQVLVAAESRAVLQGRRILLFLARKTERRQEDRAEKNEKRRKKGVALRTVSPLPLFFRLFSFLSAIAGLVAAGGRAGSSVVEEHGPIISAGVLVFAQHTGRDKRL